MKLVTLNIERGRHLGRVMPFLLKERADIVCLQEVFEADVRHFADALDARYEFVPMWLEVRGTPAHHPIPDEKEDQQQPLNGEPERCGLAVISGTDLERSSIAHYAEPNPELVLIDTSSEEKIHQTIRRSILVVEFTIADVRYTVATTHFTWTKDGHPSKAQYDEANVLISLLKPYPNLILSGDFNVPRGFNDVYDTLTTHFKDVVPSSYSSSLDPELHRAANLPVDGDRIRKYMVDYIFLRGTYRARDVRMECGLSDHCALVGNIGPD